MLPHNLLYSLIDVLFPSECFICGKRRADYPLSLCADCIDALIKEQDPLVTSSLQIDRIISLFEYGGIIKECLIRFKYGRKPTLKHVFEYVIERSGVFDTGPFDVIVPVPVHPKRRRVRGFNQSEILAGILAKTLNVPLRCQSLVKCRYTEPQAGLTRAQRMLNLKNSFKISDPLALSGRSVLLVDDVMTTGATLDTCACELLKAGVRSVTGAVLARTPG